MAAAKVTVKATDSQSVQGATGSVANARNSLRIVITRPGQQAEAWAQQLQSLGFQTESIALLEIRELALEHQINLIKEKVLHLDNYQKVIFVSQNAVAYGMRWIENFWPQLPVGLEYFAVGATTAMRLTGYDLPVADLAISETGDMTSEALLQAPQLQHVQDEKILIMRGLNGRGHLAEELRLRGAKVDYCEVYERYLPSGAASQLQQLFDREEVHAGSIVFSVHSGESLKNMLLLVNQLKHTMPDLLGQLNACPLLVPSARVEIMAKESGFIRTICAHNATDKAMTAALLKYSTV